MAYERLEKSLTKSNIWLYVCKVLMEGPKYAYQIVKEIKIYYGVKASTVTIYVVLSKMEREGLIKTVEGNMGPYRYYELTEHGRKTFARGLKLIEEKLTLLRGTVNAEQTSQKC